MIYNGKKHQVVNQNKEVIFEGDKGISLLNNNFLLERKEPNKFIYDLVILNDTQLKYDSVQFVCGYTGTETGYFFQSFEGVDRDDFIIGRNVEGEWFAALKNRDIISGFDNINYSDDHLTYSKDGSYGIINLDSYSIPNIQAKHPIDYIDEWRFFCKVYAYTGMDDVRYLSFMDGKTIPDKDYYWFPHKFKSGWKMAKYQRGR